MMVSDQRHAAEPAADRGGDGERQHEGGKAEEQVDDAHHHIVGRSARHAGDGAIDDAEQRRGEDDGDGDAERIARPEDDAREDVASAFIRAEEVREARRLQAIGHVERDRAVGRDQAGDQREGDQDHDDEQRDRRQDPARAAAARTRRRQDGAHEPTL